MSYHDHITDNQQSLIRKSALFFVASTDPGLVRGPHEIGPLNLSPKGATELNIIDATHVAYLDFGGSGDETARHVQLGGPITIMVCSFEDSEAAIVRLYGKGRTLPLNESSLASLLFDEIEGAPIMRPRQVIEVEIFRTQTSCGYGVPVMHFAREREKADRGRLYWEDA